MVDYKILINTNLSQMITNGLVSVIIPAYNSKTYVCDAIDSVVNQTYKNFEVIVIDDGSTDGTLELLNLKYPDLKIVSQRNSGLAAARNRGLELAKGDFIQLLDADDIILPLKFEESIRYLENGLDLVSCWCDEVTTDLCNIIQIRKPYTNGTNHFIEILKYNSIGVVHGPIFKKSILTKVPGFDESFGNYCADWNFWMKIIYSDYKIGIIENVHCKYRRSSLSLTMRLKYPNNAGDKKVIKKARHIIKNRSQESGILLEICKKELANRIIRCMESAYKEKRYLSFIGNLLEALIHSQSRKRLLARFSNI